tara:strand:+ start:2791 stop:3060 length:270 start_codon:yes stop_codon:yes gene_type:complete
MKRALFARPGLRIERITPHEGPSPVWNAWKPHRAQAFTDTKNLLRFAAWPKSTPTGIELREWIDSFETNPPKQAEQNEVDPTADTKLII